MEQAKNERVAQLLEVGLETNDPDDPLKLPLNALYQSWIASSSSEERPPKVASEGKILLVPSLPLDRSGKGDCWKVPGSAQEGGAFADSRPLWEGDFFWNPCCVSSAANFWVIFGQFRSQNC